MARNRYTCIAPDGTTLECTSPDYVEHTLAVIGLMRLRKPLPKINPDDDTEEVRYDRFRQWIMIGGAKDMQTAQKLADSQVYRNITDEVQFLPVTAIKVVKGLGETEDDEEPLKVTREVPFTVHEVAAPPLHVNPEAVVAINLDALD